jgi:hypothetical protein
MQDHSNIGVADSSDVVPATDEAVTKPRRIGFWTALYRHALFAGQESDCAV